MPNIRFLQNVTLYNSVTSISSVSTPALYGSNNSLIIKPNPSSSSVWQFDNTGTLTLPSTYDIKTTGGRSIVYNPEFTTLTVSNSSVLSGNVCVGRTTPLSGAKLSVSGNVVIDGSITATGSATFVNTVFTTTSSLSISNVGTGPGLVVRQEGDQAVAAFYDHESAIGLWVDGRSSKPGYVGIKTTEPNQALTVVGNISATGYIYSASPTLTKFVSSFGNVTDTTYTINHNLGVEDVVVTIVDNATKEVVYPSVTNSALNQITVTFSDAPGSNAYKAIVIG